MALDSKQFLRYHPYTTYSSKDNSCFISAQGKSLGELNTDSAALFRIGRKAYDLLFSDCSKDQFDRAYASYLDGIEEWRHMLLEMCKSNSIKMQGINGRGSQPVPRQVIQDADESQLTSIAWQIFSARRGSAQTELEEVSMMFMALVFQTLKDVDEYLMLSFLGSADAVTYAVEATTALSNAEELLRSINDSANPSDLKTAASAMAKSRHKEHYALAEYAEQHWREKISPTLSSQKAATELTKIVPLGHKKLAEYVSRWKK